MTHPFEIELNVTLPASPEQVWAAIASGPGIDSWFMGRNQVEPREGGVAAMETGGHREEALITAFEPGKRFASRTSPGPDGRFMAFEYLLEGRGGSTVLRVAHSGLLGDDWRGEYDALRRGWPFHLHTLREYLARFPGRTAVPVFAAVPTSAAPGGGRPAGDVRAALVQALGLTAPVAVGARAHAAPAGLPPLDGEVAWADDERLAVITADAIYTFHGFAGIVLMFHHLFGPGTDGAEAAWQGWLAGLLG